MAGPWEDFQSTSDGPWADFQPAPAADKPAQPYSFGPFSDFAELRARGVNAVAQMLPESIRPTPRSPRPLGAPFNLPGIGEPSAVGMGGKLLESAVSGATLPGDVYTGKVDPLSDTGIRRATDLAAMTPLSAVPSAVSKAPVAATIAAAPEIKSAAKTAMDAIRDETRAIPLNPGALENFAADVAAHVNKIGPTAKTAEKAHAAIKDIGKASREGDLGDLIDSRMALKEITRTGKGHDKAAAQMAVEKIDATLTPVAPDLVKRIKDADRNYAIAESVSKHETGIEAAIREAGNAGTGGNVGNKIRQAVEGDLKKGIAKNRLAPEVRAAMENVTNPGTGVNTLRPLAAFDPTHSKLGAMFGWGMGLANPMNWPVMAGGYASRAAYDRIIKQRAAKISEAMRAQAPAGIAAPGAPGGIIAGGAPSLLGYQPPAALMQSGILNLGVKPGNSGY